MAALPIQSLEARLLRIPFSKPISSSLGTYDGLDCVLAYLHTENGPTGLGFTMFLGGYSGKAILPFIENELAPLVAGAGHPRARGALEPDVGAEQSEDAGGNRSFRPLGR